MAWKRTTAAPAGGAAAPAPTAGTPPPPTAAAAATPSPAGLPPIAPPPQAAAPAAAAPAAEAGRRRRGAAAPAAAEPAAAAPAAVAPAATVAATVAPAQRTVPAAVSVVHPQLPGFLAALTPKNAGPSALKAITEGRTSAGEPNIFPTLYLTGGETGGKMEPHDMNAEGTDADLPIGIEPVMNILLGVRFELLLWPKGYVRGVKMSPSSRATIAFDEFAAVNVAQLAAQRYTFRNRATQDKYDPFGHPQLTLDMLAFDPQAGLYCYQTTGSYDSLFNTSKELEVAFPIVTPTPVIIQPITYNTKGSKTQEPWPEHYYKVTQASNAPGMKEIMDGFNAFLAENGSNAELGEAIAAWSKHTLTDDQFNRLANISELR